MSKCEPELPSHIHAETTVLGAILIDSAYYQKVVNRLEPEDFLLDSHRRIFVRMVELVQSGSAVDIVTLSECLKRHKELGNVGGLAYLCGLTEGLPLRPAIKDYLRILREKRWLREIIGACTEATAAAYDAEPSGEIKERLWGKLNDQNHQSAPAQAPSGSQDPVQQVRAEDS